MLKPDDECDLVTVQFLVPRKGKNIRQARWDFSDVLEKQLLEHVYVFNIVEIANQDVVSKQLRDGSFNDDDLPLVLK
jgi:hypothetical protein